MKKSYLWMVAIIGIATVLTGCSKDDNGIEYTTPDEDVEIMAKSKALSLEVSTKKPFDGEIDSSNALTARVLVSTTKGSYNSPYANGTMIFNTNGSTAVGFQDTGFSGNKTFPGNSTIYMVGLYPDTVGVGGWGTFSTTSAFTVDGKSDLMIAKQDSTSKNGTVPTLGFNHLLTKLNILVLADGVTEGDRSAVSAAWGKITDLILTDTITDDGKASINKVATVNLSTGKVAFGAGGTIPFYKAGADSYSNDSIIGLGENGIAIPNSQTATRVGYSMVTPVTLTDNQTPQNAYVLSIKTTTATTAIPVTVALKPNSGVTSTAGYAFNITLTFKGTEIKAMATVTNWKEGGSGSGTIE